jgi:hypothetical protein
METQRLDNPIAVVVAPARVRRSRGQPREAVDVVDRAAYFVPGTLGSAPRPEGRGRAGRGLDALLPRLDLFLRFLNYLLFLGADPVGRRSASWSHKVDGSRGRRPGARRRPNVRIFGLEVVRL